MCKFVLTIVGFFIQIYVANGRINVTTDSGLKRFSNMMRDIVKSCDKKFEIIAIYGSCDDEMVRTLTEINSKNIIMINEKKLTNSLAVYRKIDLFIMIIDELNPGVKIIQSRLNPFIEIDTVFVFNKDDLFVYEYAIDLFDKIRRIIETPQVYFCWKSLVNKEIIIHIITYNPYKFYAPSIWSPTRRVIFPDNRTDWIFFYTNSSNVIGKNITSTDLCNKMIFDRTKYISGYKIKARVCALIENNTLEINELMIRDHFYPEYGEWQSHLGQSIMQALNVSINITYGFSLKTAIFTVDTLTDLMLEQSIDLDLSQATWADSGYFEVINYFYLSYPVDGYDSRIITNNRGLYTPLEKIFNFYGWLTIIATTIILAIVFLVIYLSNSKKNSKFSFASFECLRLLINGPIYTRMDSSKTRIFFFVIFLYFLIIQATFSGRLAAFLTKPEYRKNVETLEDLKDPRYLKIYANIGAFRYIKDPLLLNKTIFAPNQCIEHIKHNESIACIDEIYNDLKPTIAQYNLHYSKINLFSKFVSLAMRKNWPLKNRLNNVIMSLMHSGIADKWKERDGRIVDYKLKVMEYQLTHSYYRQVKFEDVAFVFTLLRVGLSCSIFCFVLEYFILI